ncbi:unnamed protein product [Caretta caretta]
MYSPGNITNNEDIQDAMGQILEMEQKGFASQEKKMGCEMLSYSPFLICRSMVEGMHSKGTHSRSED